MPGTIQKKGLLRTAEPAVVMHPETEVKSDSVTLYGSHPLFQVALKMHALEGEAVKFNARANELDYALDKTIGLYKRALARNKKLRGQLKKLQNKRRCK